MQWSMCGRYLAVASDAHSTAVVFTYDSTANSLSHVWSSHVETAGIRGVVVRDDEVIIVTAEPRCCVFYRDWLPTCDTDKK